MSDKVARSHNSLSNRAKARDGADRKVVFRSVVDNPFRVQWPSIPMNVQNTALACVVDMLAGVAEYNISREQNSRRKRRRLNSTSRGNAAQNIQESIEVTDNATTNRKQPESGNARDDDPASDIPPLIVSSLSVGINEVTKRLERLASSHRRIVTPNSHAADGIAAEGTQAAPQSRVVLACRADIDPPSLLGHIPNLVAGCNSSPAASASQQRTWLVPLPKGAEQTLANALGLRRASMILIEDSAPGFLTLEPLLRGIPLLTAPWLLPPSLSQSVALVPTHIKQLRTTAPKDMKAAKETRSRERAAARERRKANKQSEIPKRMKITSAA
ncbi:hypothetical protein PYCCODRAFT_1415728 [Trametes coccinea BRFM310]|uniref:Uncharacterized protein n=1 Tax=Trametes coccinea (strain BRFM310) TaxID=1353009 RepID=A0A1Y2IE81_TRAC3|nr:hypothetical protein PYCCODRAFT_1415728 [Trametes coccinea BRFM310]